MDPDNAVIHHVRNTFYRTSEFVEKTRDGFERRISKMNHPLLTIVILAVIVRIALIPFSFNADMRFWGWIVDIIDNDLGLYDTEGYYYTPIWGYVLGLFSFLGKLAGITDYGSLVPEFVPYMSGTYSVSEFVMSVGFSLITILPLIIVDIAICLLIHRFVKRITGDQTKAVIASAIWAFCPLAILESCVHGMPDNISAFFLLLTVMLTYDRNYFSAGAAFSLSMLVKIFPACFVFLFVAWVFKKEGLSSEGLKKLGTAVAGFIAGFVLINIPSILKDNIWETMHFFTDRLGVSISAVNSILPLSRIVLILAILLVICFVIWKLFRERIVEGWNRIRNMDPKERDRKAVRLTILLVVVMTVAMAAVSVISVSRMGNADLVAYFSSIAMKIMLIVAFVSVALSVFIAYRFAFSGEFSDIKLFTALMLTSGFLFIWMPLPQYPVAILPLMILYVVLVDRRFFVPFIAFTVCMSLYELAMGGITAFFSVASFTDIPIMDAVLSFLDFYTNKSSFIQPNAIFITLFGAIAYISMIYIPIKWLREHNWGRLQ